MAHHVNHNYAQLAEAMALAFMDDPAFEYLVPAPERRIVFLRGLMCANISLSSRHGKILGNQSSYAALVFAPRDYPPKSGGEALRSLRTIRAGLSARMPFPQIRAGIWMARQMHHAFERHAQNCWYLQTLAVGPSDQGKGHGGSLMRELSSLAKDSGNKVYLETSKESNVSFYQHYGFAVVHEMQQSAKHPVIWCMKN